MKAYSTNYITMLLEIAENIYWMDEAIQANLDGISDEQAAADCRSEIVWRHEILHTQCTMLGGISEREVARIIRILLRERIISRRGKLPTMEVAERIIRYIRQER